MKKDGKTLVTVTSVVSKDGKTRTSTFHGKDEAGHMVHNVAVYDKQKRTQQTFLNGPPGISGGPFFRVVE
jgi:hypothetical protein